MKVIEQIPDEIIQQLKTTPYAPKENELVGIIKDGSSKVEYGYYTVSGGVRIKRVWLDSLRFIHDTKRFVNITPQHTVLAVTLWKQSKYDERIAGPTKSTFPLNTEWHIGSTATKLRFDQLTIKKSRRSDKRKK